VNDATREIVRVENLVKDFRPGFGLRTRRVLHGISFHVHPGEVFGFVGPNGAGKTTTFRVLMGLIHPTAGRATVLGHEVHETSFRRHVGFLPENPYFYEFLTGREFLRFYAKLSGVEPAARSPSIAKLLERVGLVQAADARLRTYSKGMLQRIGIAQALVHDPDVIFLDEPMSGLDPIGRKEIRDLILQLQQEGKTVFMSTHILSDVEMLCNRVAILVNGQIRYEGSIDKFLEGDEPESDVVLARVGTELATDLEERFQVRLRGLGDRVELRVPQKWMNDVLHAALESGAEVVSVAPHRVSLEAIFLSAIGKQVG
jgi:ABC-2 type transport system ATP-binding protein